LLQFTENKSREKTANEDETANREEIQAGIIFDGPVSAQKAVRIRSSSSSG